MAVVYIVVLLGVLVFIHELGHYLAAKAFGVKVISFSIGFGPRLFGFTKWGTSWDIRLLPLGGYVQMLGSDFEDVQVSEEEKSITYNYKPLWQKALITLAGPAFNLIFPIPILFFVYAATIDSDYPAVVGQVLAGSEADGKLKEGDVIKRIDGEEIIYWESLQRRISNSADQVMHLQVEREGKLVDVDISPRMTVLRDELDVIRKKLGRVGITPDMASAVVGISDVQGLGYAKGFRHFDEILSINGEVVESYPSLELMLRNAAGKRLKFLILRRHVIDGLVYGQVEHIEPMVIEFDMVEGGISALGLASANMFLTQVDPNSPADRAGLKRGDQILSLDGKSVNVFRSFADELSQNWEEEHVLEVSRGGERFETKIQLERVNITGEFQEERPIIYSGFYNRIKSVAPERLKKSMGERISFAARLSMEVTVKSSTMLVLYIVKMIEGKVSTKSLGGPIMIGHMASKAGKEGLEVFLQMMAMISINLGVINLFPIPLLDGGKLVLIGVEAVKRGPISMRTRQIVAYVGLAMVLLLMVLAFKNDFERYWHMFFG